MTKAPTDLTKIKNDINEWLGDQETFNSLVATTFQGLEPSNVKRAILEGVLRGFTYENFLQQDVYAIAFWNSRENKQDYSLVTSINYARKTGQKSGVCGKDKPIWKDKEGQEGEIETCTVTIKKLTAGHVGDFTATVYFDEYVKTAKNKNTGEVYRVGLWATKPRTMIAKVAEMHALRMACPEEMAQFYIAEEFEKEHHVVEEPVEIDTAKYEEKLRAAEDMENLKRIWAGFPIEVKQALEDVKDEMKQGFDRTQVAAYQAAMPDAEVVEPDAKPDPDDEIEVTDEMLEEADKKVAPKGGDKPDNTINKNEKNENNKV